MAGLIVTLPFLASALFFLWWSCQTLGRARVMEATPTTAVARLPRTGQVEVKGRARATGRVVVRGTERSCAWYRLVISNFESCGRSVREVGRTDESSRRLIAVDDGTGTVLVDPDGADVEGIDPLDPATRARTDGPFARLLQTGAVSLRLIPEDAKVYVLGHLREGKGRHPVMKASAEHPLVIRVGSEATEVSRLRRRTWALAGASLAQFLLAAAILF